jgi:DNA-binding transcriptional MerR regulator
VDSSLGSQEIERIERDFPSGVSAKVILDVFRQKGIRLSEGTFRKYVQAGLLPRSKRIGRKGKHRGSQGLYPVDVVRRISAIKMMMAEGLTLEEIRRSFVFFKNHIDQAHRGLLEILVHFRVEFQSRQVSPQRRRELEAELEALQHRTGELVRDVSRVGSAITALPRLFEDAERISRRSS